MPPVINFEELQREQCKASIMIEGLTGKGKSGLALMLGVALAGGFKPDANIAECWKKVYAVDTENRSLNLFADINGSFGDKYGHPFVQQLTPEDGYLPSNYLAIRDAAVKRGGEVFIADSITHMWSAKGGVLDVVNTITAQNPKMDKYRVWGTPEVASEKQNLIDVLRDHRCHVITTVRVKEKFEMQWNSEKGRNDVVSMGEQQIQQADLKYEPDLVLHMERPGKVDGTTVRHPVAKVIKSRYAILSEGDTYEFTPELCEQLRVYLSEGVDPETLLEMQRQEYIAAIKENLDTNPSAKAIWNVLKEDAGCKDTKLQDIQLNILKKLYSQVTAD